MERTMFVFCKFTGVSLQMLNENKNREIIPNPASMTIEYLKCRADLDLEVDFGLNGSLVRLWGFILFRK